MGGWDLNTGRWNQERPGCHRYPLGIDPRAATILYRLWFDGLTVSGWKRSREAAGGLGSKYKCPG